MTAPSASLWIVPSSLTWKALLVGVASADTETINGTVFTAGSSTNTSTRQFLVNASMAKTTPGLATAINAFFAGAGVSATSTGPWSLDMTSVANNDTLKINGQTLTAKTSGANGTTEFNLGSDNGASELATLINTSVLAGLTTLKASANGTTVTLTGALLQFVASTATHGVVTAADGVLTLQGYVSFYAFSIAAGGGDATMVPQIAQGSVSSVICTVTGGSSTDSLKDSEVIVVPTGLSSAAVSWQPGASQWTPSNNLIVPSSTAVSFSQGLVGYNYNLNGGSFSFSVSMQLTFGSGTVVTSASVPVALVVPDRTGG